MSNFRQDPYPYSADGGQTKRTRPKRTQVVRACDSCRQHRIKCDSRVPCSNCDAKGSRCSNAAVKSMSHPEACREIERLRFKIQELENALEQERHENNNGTGRTGHRPPPTDDALFASSGQHAFLATATSSFDGPRRRQNGIYTRAGRSGNETWYGESSLFRFIGRISSFLTSSLSKTHDSGEMLNPNSSKTLLDEPSRIDDDDDDDDGDGDNNDDNDDNYEEIQTDIPDSHVSLASEFLSPMHEEYFLGLYWESYHASVFPILDEIQFKQYYRSLRSPQGSRRHPSALVDIVVAICIQLGTSSLSKQALAMRSHTGAAAPGRQYYLRCQRLLAYELENPTLSTLQCQILSSVYLCSATFHNMYDSACATAVRTAYMLGLHMDPPDSASIHEREMRRRLWWALFIMDSKIGIKYGRPFFLHWTTTTTTTTPTTLPRLPDDDPEAAIRAGSELTPLGNNLSWLSFHREQSKLFFVARSAYARCYNLEQGIYSDPAAPNNSREELGNQAEVVSSCLKEMEAWAAGVPRVLQTKRANNGRPFSTDTSDLDVDPFSPLWLQRQRLLLELMYHNLCINLYRPFIQFGRRGPASSVVEQTAVKCALHGIALTRILRQVLKSTSILTGWHEAFQWQWNAAMTLAGFVLACSRGDSTAAAARSSLEESVANLDDFGRGIAAATSAADVVRKVQGKIDQAFRRSIDVNGDDDDVQVTSVASKTDATRSFSSMTTSFLETPTSMDQAETSLGFDEMAGLSFQDILSMASSVDQYAGPNMLWNNVGDFGA